MDKKEFIEQLVSNPDKLDQFDLELADWISETIADKSFELDLQARLAHMVDNTVFGPMVPMRIISYLLAKSFEAGAKWAKLQDMDEWNEYLYNRPLLPYQIEQTEMGL